MKKRSHESAEMQEMMAWNNDKWQKTEAVIKRNGYSESREEESDESIRQRNAQLAYPMKAERLS